ncbi:MAG: 50S ribosomal protein L4 [archaeon]
MKTKILDINGKEKGDIDLPKCFSSEIREDIVAKVIEAKKVKQPYGSSPIAGNQASASGKWNHRRHVWKSQYGRGWSRIPRKIFSRKGSQFRVEGATVPNTRGGRRAHPPKSISMLNTLKINKKEMKIALISAISATADNKKIVKKYESLDRLEKNVPFVVESKLSSLKIKDLINSLKNILGKKLFKLALKKKSVRAGIGKLRGRKYKNNAGLLIVIGNEEKLKSNAFDIVKVKELNINDLAKGGVGRLTVYTEDAIKNLREKLK